MFHVFSILDWIFLPRHSYLNRHAVGTQGPIVLDLKPSALDIKEKVWTKSIWSWYIMFLCDHAHQQAYLFSTESQDVVQSVQRCMLLTICYYYIEMRLSGSFHLLVIVDSSNVDWVDSGITGMGAGAGASEIKLEKVATLNYALHKALGPNLNVEYGCGCKPTKQCEAMFCLGIWLCW